MEGARLVPGLVCLGWSRHSEGRDPRCWSCPGETLGTWLWGRHSEWVMLYGKWCLAVSPLKMDFAVYPWASNLSEYLPVQT